MTKYIVTAHKGTEYNVSHVDGSELQAHLEKLLIKNTGWVIDTVDIDVEDRYDRDEDEPEDSPTVANCDDWGTGEGRYHGRI